MMPYVIGIGVPVGLIALWWLVYRAAMKRPNNGNEFSRDDMNIGSGGHL